MGRKYSCYNINMEKAKNQNMNRNPTGKGGFGERPEDRSNGRWRKETSISYQYNRLIRMNIEEFKRWLIENPEGKRTMAQELAYQAIVKARTDLPYLKEVTDRTEGRAAQSIDMTSGGKPIPLLDYVKKSKK